MKTPFRLKFSIAAITLITALLLHIAPSACAQDPIKIGVILPLTGDMAAVGAACRDAIQMAWSEDPERRKKFTFIFDDDHLTPADVAKAANKLINVDKVQALISTWSYGGRIVSPLAERAHIPHIGVAWDAKVADGDYNFLHLTPPSEFMWRFLEAFKKLGIKRVALLGVEESGSIFAMEEFVRLAPQYGVTVVFRESVPWTIPDFRSIVGKISQAHPQYLLFNLGGESFNLALLKALAESRVSFKYTAITSFDVLQDTTLIDGRWYVSDSYLSDEFAQRFEKAYGHKTRYGVGNFYEAARLLMYAFEKANNHTPGEAREELAKVRDLPSTFGPTTVTPEGIFRYAARYVRIQNGLRTPISLEEIAE